MSVKPYHHAGRKQEFPRRHPLKRFKKKRFFDKKINSGERHTREHQPKENSGRMTASDGQTF